jgi:DNA-binding winged helix-turn-helix (wHTH) protein
VRFVFGEVVVDNEARQVLRGGATVHVSPKAFDLLVTLIRERPRVLSKEDLHARLWPKTFVSDTSLAMLVAEARAALGESARQAGAIHTVHRRGYAFRAEVVEAAPVPAGRAGEHARPRVSTGRWLASPSGPIPLSRGENIVGRDPAAGVWLDSPSVSRRHARIHVGDADVTLEDLGSKNGTRVRGEAITATTLLHDGDELRFGSIAVTFRAGPSDPTLTEGGA